MLTSGQKFANAVTGELVEILEVDDKQIRFRVTLPQGKGIEVEHFHEIADEVYWIESGWLSYKLDGKTRKIGPGETITLPRNRHHAHWNAEAEPLVFVNVIALNPDTGRFLESLFKFTADDKLNKTGQPPFLQIMVWLRDVKSKTYLSVIPKWLQDTLAILLTPIARLLGYRAVYPKKKYGAQNLLLAFLCASLTWLSACSQAPNGTGQSTTPQTVMNQPAPDSLRTFLRNYIKEVWGRHDFELAARKYWHPDVYNANTPDLPHGPEGMKQQVDAFLTGFPDAEIIYEDAIVEGNVIAARIVLTGTHKGEFAGIQPTGRPIRISEYVFLEMKDGKLWKFYPLVDYATLMEQIESK